MFHYESCIKVPKRGRCFSNSSVIHQPNDHVSVCLLCLCFKAAERSYANTYVLVGRSLTATLAPAGLGRAFGTPQLFVNEVQANDQTIYNEMISKSYNLHFDNCISIKTNQTQSTYLS